MIKNQNNVAFLVIATGQSYISYATGLIESMREHLTFDPQIIAFTDNVQPLQKLARTFYIDNLGYPKQTLMRYHTILSKEHLLTKYDQLFYVDADMLFVGDVDAEEITSAGITAVLHPGYFEKNTKGDCETRPESTAFCDDNKHYYAGGFQGGKTSAYLQAAKEIAAAIDLDTKNGITAKWHDESHWNKYLSVHQPASILNPSFCYPEGYGGGYGWDAERCPAKLVCLDKRKRGNHPRFDNAR